MHDSRAEQLAAQTRREWLGSANHWARDDKALKIGVYSANTQVYAVFIGMSEIDAPDFTQLQDRPSLSGDADEVLAGAQVTKPRSFPAGHFGGALRCGQGTQGGGPMLVCAWFDPSTMGAVYMEGTTDLQQAAAATLALRDAAER